MRGHLNWDPKECKKGGGLDCVGHWVCKREEIERGGVGDFKEKK